ncbi:hypothetical protein CC79DRAFT_1334004 [Sarocladium strictum]
MGKRGHQRSWARQWSGMGGWRRGDGLEETGFRGTRFGCQGPNSCMDVLEHNNDTV